MDKTVTMRISWILVTDVKISANDALVKEVDKVVYLVSEVN
jgi:hypothetical protein